MLNLTDPATQDALTARMLADGVKVLFLDNLSCLCSGLKENDADAWESVLPWLLALRRQRIAVVLVHHSRAQQGDDARHQPARGRRVLGRPPGYRRRER